MAATHTNSSGIKGWQCAVDARLWDSDTAAGRYEAAKIFSVRAARSKIAVAVQGTRLVGCTLSDWAKNTNGIPPQTRYYLYVKGQQTLTVG